MPISNESTRFAATPESTTQPAKVELGLKELMAYHNPKKYAVAEPEVEAKPARETTTWFHFIAIDDADIGFRLFRASLILSLTVLISEGAVGMEWIIGIVILMPVFAVVLLVLLAFLFLGSIVFATLGKWIFRLFGGYIILRYYFAGDR